MVSASLWAGELTPEQRRRVESTMVELQFSMRAFVSYRACLRRIHAEDPEPVAEAKDCALSTARRTQRIRSYV